MFQKKREKNPVVHIPTERKINQKKLSKKMVIKN